MADRTLYRLKETIYKDINLQVVQGTLARWAQLNEGRLNGSLYSLAKKLSDYSLNTICVNTALRCIKILLKDNELIEFKGMEKYYKVRALEVVFRENRDIPTYERLGRYFYRVDGLNVMKFGIIIPYYLANMNSAKGDFSFRLSFLDFYVFEYIKSLSFCAKRHGHFAHPSMENIAKVVGCNKQQVGRSVHKLQKCKMIKIHRSYRDWRSPYNCKFGFAFAYEILDWKKCREFLNGKVEETTGVPVEEIRRKSKKKIEFWADQKGFGGHADLTFKLYSEFIKPELTWKRFKQLYSNPEGQDVLRSYRRHYTHMEYNDAYHEALWYMEDNYGYTEL